MKRARRAAKAVTNGPRIMARLQEPDARALMIEGAEEEVPSVSKIAPLLLNDPCFEPAELRLAPVKTLIGQIVRAIMAEEGYERTERGVRTDDDDKLFSTGAVYAKADDDDDAPIGEAKLVELVVTVCQTMMAPSSRLKVLSQLDFMD